MKAAETVTELRLVQHPGGNLSLEEKPKGGHGWRQINQGGLVGNPDEAAFYKSVVNYLVALSTQGQSAKISDLRQEALSN